MTLQAWLVSSSRRVFPSSIPETPGELTWDVARNDCPDLLKV